MDLRLLYKIMMPFIALSAILLVLKTTQTLSITWTLVTGAIWFPLSLFSFLWVIGFGVAYVTNLFILKRMD